MNIISLKSFKYAQLVSYNANRLRLKLTVCVCVCACVCVVQVTPVSCLVTPSLVCSFFSFLSVLSSLLASVHLFLQLAGVLTPPSIFSSCFRSLFMIHTALRPFCPRLLYDHHPTFTPALNCKTLKVRALSEQDSWSLSMC